MHAPILAEVSITLQGQNPVWGTKAMWIMNFHIFSQQSYVLNAFSDKNKSQQNDLKNQHSKKGVPLQIENSSVDAPGW